jgi:hypothetical protein
MYRNDIDILFYYIVFIISRKVLLIFDQEIYHPGTLWGIIRWSLSNEKGCCPDLREDI